MVEVIVDGGFIAPGDEDKLLNSGGPGLLKRIVDNGFVDYGEHLFWHGFGGREEAGSHPPDGKDRLFYSFGTVLHADFIEVG